MAGAFTGQREAIATVVAVLLFGYAGWQVLRTVRERSTRAIGLPVAVGSGVVDGDGPAGRVVPAAEAGPAGRAGSAGPAGDGTAR
ncbi:hypothetical protein ACFT2C_09515 [Promicromonospora sp. NPDC057138]|uniref:hypothetical protein n=1 Tax=Promicromonospora sp. NPDC057138 TaxID=3346031 RepID=UPI00363BE7B9